MEPHETQGRVAADLVWPDQITLPSIGDQVDFKDFQNCTVVSVFSEGSIEVEIPGSDTQIAGPGQWHLKSLGAPHTLAAPEVLEQSMADRVELEEQERKKLRDATDKAMEAILWEHMEDSETSSVNQWLEKKQSKGRRNHEVFLNIYDLDKLTGQLNDYALRSVGLGAYHCGVEILGDEWFFAWGDSSVQSGVLYSEPRGHQVHVFKESLSMGISPLTEDEVKKAIVLAMNNWPADSYHVVHRNCVHFAEDLLRRLKVPEPFPAWVRGAADAGKNQFIEPVADGLWRWFKWCSAEPNQEAVEAIDGFDDHPGNCCARPRRSK